MSSSEQRMTLKAAATATEATEAGTFTAYASAFGNIDRTGERVVKGAFTDTIKAWQAAGRDVPLVWDHEVGAHDIIGGIDSSTMEERDAGLYVEGQLDIEDSELAREAWRSVKRNRISLSFGFLVEKDRTASDGVKELTQIDLMEVTLTAVPANPDARVLSSKSVLDEEPDLDSMTDAELKAYSLSMIDGIDTKSRKPVQIATFEC